MIFIKLINDAEFIFDEEDILDVKGENAHIIISVASNHYSVVCETKYFFEINDIKIYQIKE